MLSLIHKEAFPFDIYDSFVEVIFSEKKKMYRISFVPFERFIPGTSITDAGVAEVSPLICVSHTLFVLCFPPNISSVYKIHQKLLGGNVFLSNKF